MQSTRSVITLAAISALAASLAGCASQPYYGASNYPAGATVTTVASVQPVGLVEYGRVTNVEQITAGPAAASTDRKAASTIVGAVVGGALGNMVGSGSGRVATTVMGAAGGAYVGNRLADNDGRLHSMQGPIYRVTVMTEQSAQRQYDVTAASDLHVGDRVRIENGAVYANY